MSEYSSNWEQYVKQIRDQIVFDMKATDIFDEDAVHYGKMPQEPERTTEIFPSLWVRFNRSRVDLATREEEGHHFYFELVASMKASDDPEADADDQLDLIGQIYEAIRDDNTLDGYANWALCRSVDTNFRIRESYIFWECLVLVEVYKVW